MRAVVLELGTRTPRVSDAELSPVPNRDQIVVRVEACALSPVDAAALARLHDADADRAPLGTEVCGVVEAVGQRAEGAFAVGDAVAAVLPLDGEGSGYAPRVAVLAASVVRRPEGAAAVAVAAVLRPGIEAYSALFYGARIVPGDVVVVCDAAREGRHVVVQLACRWGARVLAVGRTAEEAGMLRRLGAADAVLDLSDANQPFTDVVLEATRGLGADVIVGGAELPGAAAAVQALACGGKWVASGAAAALGPAEALALQLKGGAVGCLNPDVWSLSGGQQGRFAHMLADLMDAVVQGHVDPLLRLERCRLDDVPGLLARGGSIGARVMEA